MPFNTSQVIYPIAFLIQILELPSTIEISDVTLLLNTNKTAVHDDISSFFFSKLPQLSSHHTYNAFLNFLFLMAYSLEAAL